MSMGCTKIVAEPLTLTGSIGVVTGKFNLEELYKKARLARAPASAHARARASSGTGSHPV